jgi:dephospho-CoA kinase
MRYERILGRKSVIDDISFETFLADEAREMNSIHPSEQNLAYCISQADHCVINDGSLEELHQKIDTLMQNILHT